MITLHYLADSRAQRVLWMLEELGVPYEVKVYQRDRKTKLAPPELMAIHPLGVSPLLTDGDHVLAESGAIVDYLAHTYGDGTMLPQSDADWQPFRFWMHYSEGSLMASLVMQYVFMVAEEKVPALLRPLLLAVPRTIGKTFLGPRIDRALSYVNDSLKGRSFFVGETLSGADVMMIFPLEASLTRAKGSYPEIARYVKEIHARPAYQRALDKAGVPYSYA